MANPDKRIITDKPDLVGWMDGFNAASNGDRSSRADQIPNDQRESYEKNWKRGARDGFKAS